MKAIKINNLTKNYGKIEDKQYKFRNKSREIYGFIGLMEQENLQR